MFKPGVRYGEEGSLRVSPCNDVKETLSSGCVKQPALCKFGPKSVGRDGSFTAATIVAQNNDQEWQAVML